MHFEELELFHVSGPFLIEPYLVLDIIPIKRRTTIEMLRYLCLILLVSTTRRVVIRMIETCVTQVRLNRQPVTSSVIHHNQVLLWGANQQRAVILSVQVVCHYNLHICLYLRVRLGVSQRRQIVGTPEVTHLVKERLFSGHEKVFKVF